LDASICVQAWFGRPRFDALMGMIESPIGLLTGWLLNQHWQ
jgi:hypothetical protein